MGGIQSNSKDKNNPCEKGIIVKGLRQKARLLEKELNEVKSMRENESQVYEKEMAVHAFKEAEWKRERKRLREEVRKLRRKRVEGREEERVRSGVEGGDGVVVKVGEKDDHEDYYWDWPPLPPLAVGTTATSYLVEQMREERARRDEAVEKWKRLYLAIKIELDDLIQRTHQGGRLYWRAEEEEEDLMEELQRELKAKEETIELLKARLASMEQEESKREREVDILRQSLKIMSHKKKPTTQFLRQEDPLKKKLSFVNQTRGSSMY